MIESINTAAVLPAAGSDATSKDPKGQGGADPSTAPASTPATNTQYSTTQDPAAPSKPTTRLFIDQDKSTGVFVYRIVDSTTGNVLVEIPSEQIENLKDADDYAAGALISTSA
jgi:hypothetical protein